MRENRAQPHKAENDTETENCRQSILETHISTQFLLRNAFADRFPAPFDESARASTQFACIFVRRVITDHLLFFFVGCWCTEHKIRWKPRKTNTSSRRKILVHLHEMSDERRISSMREYLNWRLNKLYPKVWDEYRKRDINCELKGKQIRFLDKNHCLAITT